MAFSADQELSPRRAQRIGEELNGALERPADRAQRPLGRTARPTQTTLAEEFERLRRRCIPSSGCRSHGDARAVPERSSRSRSRCSSRRCATRASTPTRRRSTSRVRADRRRVRDGDLQRRHPRRGRGRRAGWACGSRRWRRSRPAGSSSSASASRACGECDWRCRLGVPDVNPSRLGSGGTGDRRLRVLVVDDHEVVHWGFRLMLGEQPWVERCLSARNGEEAITLARRYEPHVALVDLFVGQESGAEICERLRFLVAEHERAADLRRRADLAERRAGGGRGRASSPRTGRPPTSPARCGWSGSGMTVFKPHESPGGPPLTDREREVLDLVAGGRDEPRDRRAAVPLPAHGQGAHVVAVSQARRAQPRRGRAEGAAARPHRVARRHFPRDDSA